MIRRTAFALLAIALLAPLVSPQPLRAQAPSGGPPPANVRVGEVRLEPVRQLRLVTGQVEPARRTLVTTEQGGRVTEAPPEPGMAVAAGQPIAKLDDTVLKIDLAAADAIVREMDATVDERQALLDLTRRARQSLEDLVRANSARQRELDDARDQEAAAAARLELAKAQQQAAAAGAARIKQQIDYTTVLSPFDAFVVRKGTEVGQWVNPGDTVAELVVTERVKIKLDVPESMVHQVPLNEPLELEIVGIGATRRAVVFSVVPDADSQARTFRVLFKLDNPDGMLKPGMAVRANLPTGQTVQALTAPKDAVQTTASGPMVYANRGGKAVQVPVLIRFSHGDRFVIDAALQPGEQVVIEGNERLFPGQPLKIADQAALPTTGS